MIDRLSKPKRALRRSGGAERAPWDRPVRGSRMPERMGYVELHA
jgi:hypothetical protein